MEKGMDHWKADLLKKVCEVLGVPRLLGQIVRFEVEASSADICNSYGGCNRKGEKKVEGKFIDYIVHPEGPVIATDFKEEWDKETRVWRYWIKLFIEIPLGEGDHRDHSVYCKRGHYVLFDGINWLWIDECGGYPGDTFLSKHTGRAVLVNKE